MDPVIAIVTIVAMAVDPLLLILAAGLGFALRRRPVAGAIVAGVVVAVILEALGAALAAREYRPYRFGQSILPRMVASVAVIVGAWAAWRALGKPKCEAPTDTAERP